MALDPSPFDVMSRSGHHMIQGLPKLHIFDGLLGCRAPALGLPAVDPLGDALANVLTVQKQCHFARPLEGLQGFDHRRQFHSVVGGLQFAAKQFMDVLT